MNLIVTLEIYNVINEIQNYSTKKLFNKNNQFKIPNKTSKFTIVAMLSTSKFIFFIRFFCLDKISQPKEVQQLYEP